MSNGLIQNAYFLKRALEGLGHDVDLVELNAAAEGRFCDGVLGADLVVRPLPVRTAAAGSRAQRAAAVAILRRYHTVIYASHTPRGVDAAALAAAGVRRVHFECGTNAMLLHQAAWLGMDVMPSGAVGASAAPDIDTRCAHGRTDDVSDASWLIPCMRGEHAAYLRVLAGRRARQQHFVPHTWSPEILAAVAACSSEQQPDGPPPWRGTCLDPVAPALRRCVRARPPERNSGGNSGGAHVLILESNMTLFKSAWSALLMCEAAHARDAAAIAAVYVLGAPDTAVARAMVSRLAIASRVHLKTERVTVTHVLATFAQLAAPVVVLSHTRMSQLNYLYYDALYLDFRLAHNSEPLAAAGLGAAYAEGDIEGGGAAVLAAAAADVDDPAALAAARRWLFDSCDPASPSVQRELADVDACT